MGVYLNLGLLAALVAVVFPIYYFNIDIGFKFNNIDTDFQQNKFEGKLARPNYDVVSSDTDTLYTKEELAKYDGSEGSLGLYLGLLGRVYDVSAGARHYGAEGGYSFFRAKDGTKAFMTGDFTEEGLTDDVEGLTNTQMLELEDWVKFYDTSYSYKGKLIGNFYDQNGTPTGALHKAVEDIGIAHVQKQAAEKERAKMPPCNSENAKNHRRVWCTTKSGGIKRDWVGFPRMIFKQGDSHPRCVCVHRNMLNSPLLLEYEGCNSNAESCALKPFESN